MTDTITRIFVDTETTGLDPDGHEILEVAVVRELVEAPYTRSSGAITRWSQKILPQHIGNAEEGALRVNGYTPEKWVDAVPFETAIPALLEMLLGCKTWIGQNPSFDLRFIRASLKRCGIDLEEHGRFRPIDTTTLAHVTWGLDGTLSLGLDSLRKHLGISPEGAHGALKDAMDCREIYWRSLAVLYPMGVPLCG